MKSSSEHDNRLNFPASATAGPVANTSELYRCYDKRNCMFIQFDIAEFYPSISKELLTKSIDHAKNYITIKEQEVVTIMHARRSLLFNNDSLWVKKNGDPNEYIYKV